MPRSHAHLPRLFVGDDLAEGATLALGRDQSLYLAAVLRKGPGDEAVLFNGRDGAWRAVIAAAPKRAVTLEPVERIAVQTPPSDLWYGFAPLKAGRLDYMVQKATEMGVGTMRPVTTEFTQVTKLNPGRLRANIVEAAEQCEVLSVPVLEEPVTLPRLLGDWDGARALVFCDEAAPSGSPVAALERLRGRAVGLLVGPEGGFSSAERARLLACDFVVPVSLGPRILRADTAAVAALAVIQSIIGDWR